MKSKTESSREVISQLAVEMEIFEQTLRREFTGGSPIQAAACDLVSRGGKRLRPAMLIAAAHLGEYRQNRAMHVAMAIEVIHSATLLHDDVIDHADTRRGESTLHTDQGDHMAIYTGDFLLARGLRLIARSGLQLREMARIADAVEQICTGEVAQYLGRNKVPGYRAYLRRIMSKTGILFAASAASGGYCAELPDDQIRLLWHFGMRFGAAFQIRDDLIDMDESKQSAGKPTGHDLVEGVLTLPVLLASADRDFRRMLDIFLNSPRSHRDVQELIRLSHQLGAIRQSRQILQRQVDRCGETLDRLPAGPGRDMLFSLLDLFH
ncbi:MAG: polyprenyl synthetase family protein [Clostridia bacterium]|nr:polyprenyl synthetase family protein [Eubacteriales bacterium]MDD3866756.1 polyprenyl synthetase family protein [Eubacteriales bacterium]NCC47951.1 polyprenyl synthetase family protein [Clostridia bacterium]